MEPQRSSSSPPKYNKVLIVVIVVLVLIILLLLFKSPLPPPPGPPPPPNPEREKGLKVGKIKYQTGIVLAYQYNAHLDVNALQLKTADKGVLTVEFLPHTAQAVMQQGPVGAAVDLEITSRPNDEAVVYRLVSIKNRKSATKFIMQDLPPPPEVPGHVIESFNLEKPDIVMDNYGGIVALRKRDLFFHFKPGLVDDISGLIKSAHRFGIQAVRRDDDLGFINVKHDKVYIVLSLTIDNKTFLVR